MALFLHVTPREEQWRQRHERDMNRLWRACLLSRDAARQRLPQLRGGTRADRWCWYFKAERILMTRLAWWVVGFTHECVRRCDSSSRELN